MNAFPWVINGVVEANVSKRRLEKLLLVQGSCQSVEEMPGEDGNNSRYLLQTYVAYFPRKDHAYVSSGGHGAPKIMESNARPLLWLRVCLHNTMSFSACPCLRQGYGIPLLLSCSVKSLSSSTSSLAVRPRCRWACSLLFIPAHDESVPQQRSRCCDLLARGDGVSSTSVNPSRLPRRGSSGFVCH